jgi:hypothetical protein
MIDKAMTGNSPRPNGPAHTPMMAQYQGVTLQAASRLGFWWEVARPVPL